MRRDPPMRHALAAAVVLSLCSVAMSACSQSGEEAPRAYLFRVPLGQTYELRSARVLSEADEIQRFEGPTAPRLVFLGEHHADPRSQAFQVRFLRALLSHGHPVTVGLEMFPPQSDAALEQWRQGRLTEAEFVEQSGWYETWGFPWSAYRGLFTLIRDAHLPVHGLNVNYTTRKAVRESPQGLLPPELAAEIGELDLTVTPHRDYFADTMVESQHGSANRRGALTPDSPQMLSMQRIQVLWDTVMGVRAARLAAAAPPGGVVVAILGSGHVAYGLGANLRAARTLALPQLTVWDDVQAPEDLDAQGLARIPVGMADWVRVYAQGPDIPVYPSLSGLKLIKDPQGVKVEASRVTPEDPRAVFHVGDIIKALRGEPISSLARLRLAVEGLAWNEPVQFTVLRAGATQTIVFVPKQKD